MKKLNKQKFEKVKEIIVNNRLNSDEIIYISEEDLKNVFPVLMEKAETIDNFAMFENACDEDILFEFIAKHKKQGRKVSRYIAVRYVRQLDDKELIKLLKKGESLGINTNLCLLSRIEIENKAYPFDFVLFDKELALILKNDIGTGYYLTSTIETINRCLQWLEVDQISENSIKQEFLQEPLMKSADMINEVASLLCTRDHMNLDGCYWYHSIWQYLRLLDMVSTPSWHHDFYINQISLIAKNKKSMDVLISGAADYSTLSYTMYVLEKLNITTTYSVLDLCETPLFACRWYGKRYNKEIVTLQKSIFDLNEKDKYDLICTDAFLTRFSKEKINQILSLWYESLHEGGFVITTVRIHDENHICPDVPLKDAVDNFVEKAYKRAMIWGKYINLSPEELANKARIYATQMKSNCLGTKEDVLNSFLINNFEIIFLNDVEIKGELYPSRYLRIVGKKI